MPIVDFQYSNFYKIEENPKMSDENAVKMTTMNYDKNRPAAENPVKIEDLSLRDGHQSLFATRGQNRRHDSGGRNDGRSRLLGHGSLGRCHF